MPALLMLVLEVATRPSPVSAAMIYLRRQLLTGATHGLVGVVSALPFVVLLAVCALASRTASAARVACIGVGGLLGTLVVMVPGNLLEWLSMAPEVPAATPGMLGELFLPLMTLVSLGVGLTVGWIVSLSPRFTRGSR